MCSPHHSLVFVLQTHENPVPLLISSYTECRSLAVPPQQLTLAAPHWTSTAHLRPAESCGWREIKYHSMWHLVWTLPGAERLWSLSLNANSTPNLHHQTRPSAAHKSGQGFSGLAASAPHQLAAPSQGFCVYRINTQVQYPVVYSALS